MKKQVKKLTLNRETVHRLEQSDLSHVLGGVINVRTLLDQCEGTVGCTGTSC